MIFAPRTGRAAAKQAHGMHGYGVRPRRVQLGTCGHRAASDSIRGALSKITRGLRRGGSTLCRKLESRERNITFRGGGGCVVIRHYYRLDTTSPKC